MTPSPPANPSTVEQTEPAPATERCRAGRWRRRGLLLLCVLLAGAGAAAACKAWLAPHVIRLRVRQALGEVWTGPFEIEEVTTDWTGRTRLSGVVLRDGRGRQWARIGTGRLIPQGGNADSTFGVEVDLSDVELTVHLDEGRFAPPLKAPPDRPRPWVKLRRLGMRSAQVTLADADGVPVARWDEVNLEVTDEPLRQRVRLWLRRDRPLLTGSISPTEADLHLRIDETEIRTGNIDDVMALLGRGLGIVEKLHGRVVADVRVGGRLHAQPALRIEGAVRLIGWSLSTRYGAVLDNLNLSLTALPDGRLETRLLADAARGQLKGQLMTRPGAELLTRVLAIVHGWSWDDVSADLADDQRMSHYGNIEVRGVDLAVLMPRLDPNITQASGRLRARHQFQASGLDPTDGWGQGMAFLDDAQLWDLPIFGHLYRQVGLERYDPLTRSDVQMNFETRRHVMVLHQCLVASRLLAVQTDPNATVDLETGSLQASVVYAPMKKLESVFDGLGGVLQPLATLVTGPAASLGLTRLDVTGNIYRPNSIRFTPRPITSLKHLGPDMMQFFRSATGRKGSLTTPDATTTPAGDSP